MITLDTKSFAKDMSNIIDYSIGFLDGIQSGKRKFLENLGRDSIDLIKEFIDSNARVNPAMLHHVYEWNQTGSPSARLFDIDYTVSNLGLSFKSTFSQSRSIKDGSKVPFYDKARIMEAGIPVTITPKKSGVLVFDDNGEEVFTKNPVYVESPGGDAVAGSFESTFNQFFKYFSQAFIKSSGISQYLENPVAYKSNLPMGKRLGRGAGVSTGYRWIINAGMVK